MVQPWACLSENISAQTRVLYFDSMGALMPLARREQFARALLELDAIRQGSDAGTVIDTAVLGEVQSRIMFEPVKAS